MVEPQADPIEMPGNDLARFETTIKFGQNVVGYAVGRTKKDSKLNACKHILDAMVPLLYKDWLAERKINISQVPLQSSSNLLEEPRPQSPSLDNMMHMDENPELADSHHSQQPNSISLDQMLALTQQNRTEEELALEYSEYQLDAFRNKTDAPVDDRRILSDPQLVKLTEKHKPMALMNTLKQKEDGVYDIRD